jgi:cation diffusion facilitator family transporter
VADTSNQVFLLISLSLAGRRPDDKHPFGYGRERFVWAFLAAIMIFVSGAVFSVGEGVQRLLSPKHDEGSALIAFIVLAVALAAEGASLTRAARQTRGEQRQTGLPFARFVRQSRNPTSKTVVFEDSVAVVGVLLAAAGLGATVVTGSPVGDAVASIAIGVLLAGVAIALAKDTKSLLVGESARPEERAALEEVLRRPHEVEALLELLTMALGPDELLVAARLDLRDGMSVGALEALAERLDGELRDAVPAVSQVFLDPTPRDHATTRSPKIASRPPVATTTRSSMPTPKRSGT